MTRNYSDIVSTYTRISSRFGPRSAPVNGASTIHKGVDLSASIGSAVFAPYEGVVEQVVSAGNGPGQAILST